MRGYFQIPVKDGYIDIDTAEDIPITLIYDAEAEYGYVFLEYKVKKKNWKAITQEEFEAKREEIAPYEPTEAVSGSAQDIQAALISLQQFSLMRELGIEIPLEQQAEMEVKALGNIDIPTAGDEWKAGQKAEAGAEVTYNSVTYKCVQPHITQADWPPDKTPALWAVVQKEPEGGGILPWVAGEAVKAGDKRTYKGKTYECVQGHTAQAGWEPPNVAALWSPVE